MVLFGSSDYGDFNSYPTSRELRTFGDAYTAAGLHPREDTVCAKNIIPLAYTSGSLITITTTDGSARSLHSHLGYSSRALLGGQNGEWLVGWVDGEGAFPDLKQNAVISCTHFGVMEETLRDTVSESNLIEDDLDGIIKHVLRGVRCAARNQFYWINGRCVIF